MNNALVVMDFMEMETINSNGVLRNRQVYVPTRIIQIPVHLIFRFSYEKRCHTRFRCIPRNDCDYYYVKWKVKLNSVPKFAPI